jgi:3-methyladenine DNA glycosylase/8-oxoguanine DNA glycosylase
LEKLSDAEITAILTKYKYVGQWTVNMMLMFTYYRPNIMPLSDLGVIKGLKILYNKTTISDKFADEIIKKFSNRLTLLTFCLWRIALNPIKSK